MKNSTFRRYVDLVMYAALCFVTGSGLLLGYRLVACSRGGTHGMTLWGYSRHEWGTMHLWCAYLVLALLVIHLVLNFTFIKNVVMAKSRLFLALGFIIGAAIILGFLLVPLKQKERGSSCGSSCSRANCSSTKGAFVCPGNGARRSTCSEAKCKND